MRIWFFLMLDSLQMRTVLSKEMYKQKFAFVKIKLKQKKKGESSYENGIMLILFVSLVYV